MTQDRSKYWYKDIREITTLKELLDGSVEMFPDNPAFWTKKKRGGEYLPITYSALKHDVDALGTWMLEHGMKGQRIAVMGANCYEWIASYLAIVNGTGIVVPIDKELSGKEVNNLMRTAECDTIFITKADCKKLAGQPNVKRVIVMEFYGDRLTPDEKPESSLDIAKISAQINEGREVPVEVLNWRDLLSEGEALLAAGKQSYLQAEIDPDALAVILFTSGTTGNPKGVMLCHRNIAVNIMDVCRVCYVPTTTKTLSLLPIHHTYECTLGMLLVLYRGASTAFGEGLKYISQNMQEAQNTLIIVVPRVLEMVYGRIQKTLKKSGKEKMFNRVMKLNRGLQKVGIDVRRKMFKQVIDQLGGKLEVVITGAAALSPEIIRAFEDFGITVLQGFGMTECTPLIAGTPMTANKERYKKAGSVGVTVETGEVKIVNPDENGIGEILFKGPNQMMGYYNMPEATAETIDAEGWLHTGDLGYMDAEGWIYLTGRSKNVIVTKTGENVYPEEIEEFINQSPYIEDSMVFPYRGNDEETVGVQILANKEEVAEALGHEPSWEELDKFFKELIQEMNQELSVYKRMRDVFVRRTDFIRTTTRKIKRQENMDI